MPDVLSAEAIQERLGRGVEWETEVLFSELLRSHEQLRGERDAAVSARDFLAHDIDDLIERKEAAEAAVRAGGEAAAALRTIAESRQATSSGVVPDEMLEWGPTFGEAAAAFAREALASLSPDEEQT